ncbi:MAG: DUF885 family protein [Terriglobales bacterium]
MKKAVSLIIPAMVILMASSYLYGQTSVESRRAQLKATLDEEWEYELQASPELATQAGNDRYNDRLSDYSAKSFADHSAHAGQMLRRLESIDTSGLPEQEKLNKILMARNLQDEVTSAKFKDWEMPVTQFGGVHLDYASMPTDVPLVTVKDYENYLSRLRQLPRVFEQVTANMRLGMTDHLMPPRYLLEKVTTQAQSIADDSLQASPFTQPVLKFPDTIHEDDQKRLREAIFAAVKNEVAPAYAKFAAFVRDEYAPKGRTELGVWALPDGDARYRFDIHSMTTTEMDPEAIHQLGLKTITQIEHDMLAVAQGQGFADLKSFNEHIRKDPQLYGKSGQQIFDLYQHYADQMYAKLPQLFGRLPKNKLAVVPMEAYRAPDEVPADYSLGAGDGSRPGRINVNEYNPQGRLLLNVEAIAYHEGVPGHHLQFSIMQELSDVPPFRKFGLNYNAYTEGWAFYAERLGKEVGFYQDPYSEYGRLENEMWRAVRLVVDTGVHYKHWSREQMVDFFRQHTAMDEPNIQTEVDRYIAWPAQALSYQLGKMKILELRERARHELGSNFDIRSFHDAVLDEGALPLDLLETKIDLWIKSQATAGKK